MARLFPTDPTNPLEVAWFAAPGGGTAAFTVDNGSGPPPPTVEIWERTIPWPGTTPPPPPPPFSLGGTFTSPTPVTRSVPLGGLYQVRLFRGGQGSPSGNGDVLGRLDFPCLARMARTDMLTRCAGVPQLDISPGGTFVSMAFATAVPSMVRAQLGATTPTVNTPGDPALFTPSSVVASAVSDAPKFLHKATLIDELLQPDTTLHAPLLPGNPFFFVILAWDAAGSWDFVWNTTGKAPTVAPETVTAKRRAVGVRLAKLHVFDDSDDLSDGEGDFKLVITRGAGQVNTQSFSTSFATGETVAVPPNMQFNSGLEVVIPATQQVLVRVDGHEDDTGSFPFPDDDDFASAPLGFTGGHPLHFPVGEGKETVDNELLALPSVPHAVGAKLSFLAELRISVKYDP